ncbi:MAG: phosphotransferase [Candidatus Hydrogenedentota bacterium]
MAEAVKGADALVNVIREHYDVGGVQPPEYVALAHQRRHQKLVVQTGKGKFLIKTYKKDPRTLDTLRFQHRLSEHLFANGLPVARILPARDGKRIVEGEAWALELQQFIEGKPMAVTGQTLVTSARALGKFHQVCREFPRPDRDTRKWRFSEVPRKTFASLYERARELGAGGEVDKHCNTIAIFLRDASNALSFEHRDMFETGLIHGDWHAGNLFFRGEQLVAILDLEFAGDGCYLEDLSYALSNLCVRTATDTNRLERRADLLLDHYQLHRSLTPAEERALYFAVGVKHVATVAYQTEQMDGTVAGHTAADWMSILATQCAWLGERAQAIRSGGEWTGLV